MKFRRIALALAIVLALMPLTALADLSRGDRGEDVKELQKLLFETGWLFEEPDGIFGKNTEAALISFQKFMGLNANGRADSATMQLLRQSWSDLHRTASTTTRPTRRIRPPTSATCASPRTAPS